MHIIVIMPCVYQARRDIRPGCHEETCEIRYSLVAQDIDCRQDDHPDERYHQREHNVEGSLAEVVRRLGHTEKHHRAYKVWSDRPKVCFDS